MSSDTNIGGTFRQLKEGDDAQISHRQIGCTNQAFQPDTGASCHFVTFICHNSANGAKYSKQTKIHKYHNI